MVYVVLGTLLVWFGMYGFNPGAVLLTAAQGANVSAVVAKAAVNSALAASSGALAALVMAFFRWAALLDR
jgi:Amt family ammonium transporter